MSDAEPSPLEFMIALRHPSADEIEYMRRLGNEPGACGLNENGNLVAVQGPPERMVRGRLRKTTIGE